MKINLNHTSLYLSEFECGKTQNIEVRIGRKVYMLDIDKNRLSAFVELYEKRSTDRRKYSKYGANLHSVCVKSTAILSRDFFENIAAIESAQRVVTIYKGVLN